MMIAVARETLLIAALLAHVRDATILPLFRRGVRLAGSYITPVPLSAK